MKYIFEGIKNVTIEDEYSKKLEDIRDTSFVLTFNYVDGRTESYNCWGGNGGHYGVCLEKIPE